MAVGHRLPNGYIVLLLTPREATLHRDQILDPEQYPWMSTESQMVAMEVRSILTNAVSEDALQKLEYASNELVNIAKAKAEEEAEANEMKIKGYWQCECSYVNGREHSECENCGVDRPEEVPELP